LHYNPPTYTFQVAGIIGMWHLFKGIFPYEHLQF
jgi:hypothetical protein